jgi:hypothetical protein
MFKDTAPSSDEEQFKEKRMPWWGYLIIIASLAFIASNIFSYKAGQNKPNTYFGPASCAKAFVAVDDYLKNSQAELSSALTDTPVSDKVSVEEVAKLRKQCVGELPVIKAPVTTTTRKP